MSSAKYRPFCLSLNLLVERTYHEIHLQSSQFLQYAHYRYPIPRQWGWNIGYLQWVLSMISVSPLLLPQGTERNKGSVTSYWSSNRSRQERSRSRCWCQQNNLFSWILQFTQNNTYSSLPYIFCNSTMDIWLILNVVTHEKCTRLTSADYPTVNVFSTRWATTWFENHIIVKIDLIR